MISRTRSTPGYTYLRIEREQQSAYVCVCVSHSVSNGVNYVECTSVTATVPINWCNWDCNSDYKCFKQKTSLLSCHLSVHSEFDFLWYIGVGAFVAWTTSPRAHLCAHILVTYTLMLGLTRWLCSDLLLYGFQFCGCLERVSTRRWISSWVGLYW